MDAIARMDLVRTHHVHHHLPACVRELDSPREIDGRARSLTFMRAVIDVLSDSDEGARGGEEMIQLFEAGELEIRS